MSKIDPAALPGHWLHSHEEDSGKRSVFRGAGYAFPPARGRAAFELGPDGAWIDKPIAAGDGNARQPAGRWELSDSGELRLIRAGASEPARVCRVIAADADRLVLEEMS